MRYAIYARPGRQTFEQFLALSLEMFDDRFGCQPAALDCHASRAAEAQAQAAGIDMVPSRIILREDEIALAIPDSISLGWR